MRRGLLAVGLVAASLGWAAEARAAQECRGLDVCISVPGPWVAVPAAQAGRTRTVYYQLTCPRNSIVGGLDAVRGDRSLDVRFLGRIGSPVNPGITTARSVVFVVTHVRPRRTYFRPFIGCIPTSGGGGRETTGVASPTVPNAVRPAAARPPSQIRRVRTLRVRPGALRRLELGCGRGERLVGASHAVAFRMRAAPSERILATANAVRRRRGQAVEVRARRSEALPASVRMEVQVHAICARVVP